MIRSKNFFKTITRGVIFGAAAFAAATALAWSGPPANPPGNNVSAPINIGATAQTKTGSFTVNTGNNAFGVMGISSTNDGVDGTSAGGAGVHGISTNYYGVQGVSTNDYGGVFSGLGGVYASATGSGGAAIQGVNSGSASNEWAGIFENNVGPYGLYAQGFVPGQGNYYTELDNGAYGVLTNGTIQTSGQVNVGGAALYNNGDLYMPWAGNYLSTILASKGSSNPTTFVAFSNVTGADCRNYGGGYVAIIGPFWTCSGATCEAGYCAH